MTLVTCRWLQASCGEVFRLGERKVGGTRIGTGETEQKQYKSCLRQRMSDGLCLPSDTLRKKFLSLAVESNLNPEEDLGAGPKRLVNILRD